MAQFLEKYVREPIQALIAESPNDLPDMTLRMSDSKFEVSLPGEDLSIERHPQESEASEPSEMPEDVSDEVVGP